MSDNDQKIREVNIREVSIKEETSCCFMDMKYPQYRLNDQSPDLFNEAISKLFNQHLSTLIELAANLQLESKARLNNRYTTYQSCRRFISLKVDFYYDVGGLHAGHDLFTISYDIKKMRLISLQELFSSPDYLPMLSDISLTKLQEKYPELAFAFADKTFLQGILPIEENYQLWALSNTSLIIFFKEYQVAPYSAGGITS